MFNTQPFNTSLSLSLSILATCCLATSPACAGQQCLLIANGSFDRGLTGWSLNPTVDETGMSFGGTFHQLEDGTTNFLIELDEQVLRMSVAAAAGDFEDHSAGIGSASATLTLSTSTVVTDRYFKFRLGGSWDVVYKASGSWGYQWDVTIRDVDDHTVTHHIEFGGTSPAQCPAALSIIGVTDLDHPDVYVDLDPDGTGDIAIGDDVEVVFALNAHAAAQDTCDYGEMGITVWVDDFAFCDWAPNYYDLTGDGIVDAADLAVLLGNWGPCIGGCYGDFALNGVVDAADLAILLGNWG